MNVKSIKKIAVTVSISIVSVVILCAVLIILSNRAVRKAAENKVMQNAGELPHKTAALVLGCTPEYGNPYFIHRIKAAKDLYNSGKCDYLIVSGDNSRKEYDEPTAMKNALIRAGIPDSAIYRDYAGFRTLDSIVRADAIFSQDDIIIVSQRFHLERALFIAKTNSIEAIGYPAEDVYYEINKYVFFREKLARVKAVLDVMLGKKPKFFGEKVILGTGDIEP